MPAIPRWPVQREPSAAPARLLASGGRIRMSGVPSTAASPTASSSRSAAGRLLDPDRGPNRNKRLQLEDVLVLEPNASVGRVPRDQLWLIGAMYSDDRAVREFGVGRVVGGSEGPWAVEGRRRREGLRDPIAPRGRRRSGCASADRRGELDLAAVVQRQCLSRDV